MLKFSKDRCDLIIGSKTYENKISCDYSEGNEVVFNCFLSKMSKRDINNFISWDLEDLENNLLDNLPARIRELIETRAKALNLDCNSNSIMEFRFISDGEEIHKCQLTFASIIGF